MAETWQAKLWKLPGKGGWTFVSVPAERAPPVAGPWGRFPVLARVDGVAWHTSVWRDSRHGWLLPVPARVRGGKGDGDSVAVLTESDPSRGP